jgi:hypothetical protein
MIPNLDFSNVPSEVAIFLSDNSDALNQFADSLTVALRLNSHDSQVFRDSLVGVAADLVDQYLPRPLDK